MSNINFLTQEVPQLLKGLDEDAKPEWGTMNAGQMLDHLRRGVVLSVTNLEDEVLTPDDKLPGFKRYLMSSKPFVPHSKKPAVYDTVEESTNPFPALKEELMERVEWMIEYFNANPNHIAVHPNFGHLNGEEWLQLHYKHFTHHFTQFALIKIS